MVASGNKDVRTLGVCVATKAGSSSRRRCLQGHVCGHIRHNNEVLPNIPECHITKSGQEPIKREKLQVRIRLLVGMGQVRQEATRFERRHKLFKAEAALSLQLGVFLGVPGKRDHT